MKKTYVRKCVKCEKVYGCVTLFTKGCPKCKNRDICTLQDELSEIIDFCLKCVKEAK